MEQADLLRRVIELLEDLEITYMLVGSMVSGAYGEPRATVNIDIVVDLSANEVRRLYGVFPPDDYYVSVEAAEETVIRGGQFNVIHPASGNKVDFLMARRDPWGRTQVSRRKRTRILPDRGACAGAPADALHARGLFTCGVSPRTPALVRASRPCE